MEKFQKLSRTEMKNVNGGKSYVVTYLCNDTTNISGGSICNPATGRMLCLNHGGFKVCNG
jgi:hypothetical protein